MNRRFSIAKPLLVLSMLFILVVSVIGFYGCSSTTTGSNSNSSLTDEPRVIIETHTAGNLEKDGRASDPVITGFSMHVSGTAPDGSHYNFRNFPIKGAGVQGIYQPPYGLQQFDYPYMDYLADKSGANCIRCYGAAFVNEEPEKQANDVKAAFDWAKKATNNGNPMFVGVGITLGTASQINYQDTSVNSKLMTQRKNAESMIDKVMDLDNSRQLLWIIGNELVDDPNQKEAVYQEINTIAKYIKNKGSNIPCMTAVQTITTDELKIIAKNCPSLDILGINDYYGTFGSLKGGGYLNTLHTDMETSRNQADGWKKPYIVSEFGSYCLAGVNLPTITLPDTPAYTKQGYYGLEANSTQIAADYYNNYISYIKPNLDGNGCLGSFCYVWENPVFSNLYAYFYEMFVSAADETPNYNPAGKLRLQAVDEMVKAWEGAKQTSEYPQIVVTDGDPQGIACNFKATQSKLIPDPVAPGSSLTATVTATYSKNLTFNWYVVEDTDQHYNPQKWNAKDNPVTGTQNTDTTGNQQANTMTFNAPATKGNYQLRVVVSDGVSGGTQNTCATATVFFRVK